MREVSVTSSVRLALEIALILAQNWQPLKIFIGPLIAQGWATTFRLS